MSIPLAQETRQGASGRVASIIAPSDCVGTAISAMSASMRGSPVTRDRPGQAGAGQTGYLAARGHLGCAGARP